MEDNLKECCKQEENLSIKFLWVASNKYDEGGYEPVCVYCTVCDNIVKDIPVGGYIGGNVEC